MKINPLCFLLGVALMFACGDDAPPPTCLTDTNVLVEEQEPACNLARKFAALASPELLVDQPVLTRFTHRLRRALVAEPLLGSTVFAGDRFSTNSIYTSETTIRKSWASGALAPKSSELAFVFKSVDATLVSQASNSDISEAIVSYGKVCNLRILAEKLAPYEVKIWQFSPEDFSLFDSKVSWDSGGDNGTDEATMTLEADIGLYDGLRTRRRHLRAVISPDTVTVYDMGGDPYFGSWAPASATIPYQPQ